MATKLIKPKTHEDWLLHRASGIGSSEVGTILGVNPFDQPGVEDYKRNMFALLGKPGYEAQTEAIKARI